MAAITKRQSSDTEFPHELLWKKGGAVSSADTTMSGAGGGVPWPEPDFSQPWTVGNAYADEEEFGAPLNTFWFVPTGDTDIRVEWRRVKKDGTYGPIHRSEAEIDENSSAAGYFEWRMFGGDRPWPENSRVDIVRAMSWSFRQDKHRNPPVKADVATTPPPAVGGQATNTGVSNPPALATILFGEFADATVFIRSVQTLREKDRVQAIVKIGISKNVRSVALMYSRWPKKTDPTGGPFSYGPALHSEVFYTTHEDRNSNDFGDGWGTTEVVLHGLHRFTDYDIRRIIAEARVHLNNNDDSSGLTRSVKFPALKADVATDPQDTTPNNDGAGHAYLGRFNTGHEIDGTTQPPRFTDLVQNSPDLTTEKDDSIQGYRMWADDSDHTKTFAQVFVDRVAVKVRNPDNAAIVHTYEHILTLEEQTAVSYTIYDRSHLGHKWTWFRCVRSNASDRDAADGVVNFFAGAASNDHNLLTVSLALVNFSPADNRRVKGVVTTVVGVDANGNSPVPAKHRIFESDADADTTYHLEKMDGLKGEKDDVGVDMATPGTHVKTYSLKRPAGSNRFYYVDTRVIGDPIRSVSSHVNTASASDQAGGAVDTVPPGALNTPALQWTRKNGLRVRVTKPDHSVDGFHNLTEYEWQIATTNTATPSTNPATVLNEDGTLTSIAGANANEYPIYSAGPKYRLTLKRSQLDAGVRAGSTPLYVRVRAYNVVNNVSQVGTWSSWSSALSPAKPERDSTPAADDDGTHAPVIQHAKLGMKGLNIKVTDPAFSHVPKRYRYEFASGAGSGTGFNPYTGQSSAGVNTDYPGSHHFQTSLSLADCSSTFYDPTSGSLSLYVRARLVDVDDDGNERENGIFTSWAAVGAKPGHGDRGRTEALVNTMHTAMSHVNGGSCCYGNDTVYELDGTPGNSDEIGQNCSRTVGGTRINNHNPGSDGGSTGCRWDHTAGAPNGRLQWNSSGDTGGAPSASGYGWCWKMQRGFLRANKSYTLTFKLSAASSLSSPSIVVDIYEEGVGAVAGTSVTFSAGEFTLSSVEQFIAVFMTVSSGYTSSGGRMWLRVRPATSNSARVYGREFMFVRGTRAMAYAPSVGEIQADATTDSGGTDPTAGGQSDDTQGGYGKDFIATDRGRIYL